LNIRLKNVATEYAKFVSNLTNRFSISNWNCLQHYSSFFPTDKFKARESMVSLLDNCLLICLLGSLDEE